MIDTKHNFSYGKLLELLIATAGQKNASLARELRYDVSYISKWINGVSLPTAKNIELINQTTAHFLALDADDEGLEELLHSYEADSVEQLRQKIKSHLDEAYLNSLNKPSRKATPFSDAGNNANICVNPRMQRVYLNEHLTAAGSLPVSNDVIILADFFALGKEDKLSFAGLNENEVSSFFSEPQDGNRYRYILSLDRTFMNLTFDTVLFIHMLTTNSLVDTEMFYYPKAPCSIIVVAKDQCLHMSALASNHRCILSTTTTERDLVSEMYETLESMMLTQSTPMFRKVSMESMILDHSYMQTVISPEIKWVVGKMSEHFLPEDIFNEIADEVFKNQPDVLEEARKLHLLMNNVCCVSDIKLMVYESAFNQYLLSGELDFFNHKVMLSVNQREAHIRYMQKIFSGNNNIKVHLINGNFASEFKSMENPCFYLADSICYLRLNNRQYKNNIYIVANKVFEQILRDFFQTNWQDSSGLICSNSEDVEKKMQSYINTFQLLHDLY